MYKRYPKHPASLRFEMGSQMGTPQKSASFCNLIWRHSRCKELACGRSNTSTTTLPVPLTDYDMNGNSRCCKYRHLALWWKAWQARAASGRMTWGGRILAKHCQALSGPPGQPLEPVSKSKKWKSDDAMDTWRTDVSKLSQCHFLSGQVQKVRLLWILGRKFCHGHWSISIDIAAKKMGLAWGFFEVRSSSKVKLAALSTMNITHTPTRDVPFMSPNLLFVISVLCALQCVNNLGISVRHWTMALECSHLCNLRKIQLTCLWQQMAPPSIRPDHLDKRCKNVQAGEGMTWWQVKPR